MLDSLHIKNFRCFEELTIESLGRVNLIVGKNNSGKSTLLEAIDVFSKLGSTQSIQALLAKRKDYLLINNTSSIFHNNQLPQLYEERLKIGDLKSFNSLQIFSNDIRFSNYHASKLKFSTWLYWQKKSNNYRILSPACALKEGWLNPQHENIQALITWLTRVFQ